MSALREIFHDCSLLGELLSVSRTALFAKKVNGAITEKYLWQGLTRLLAIYDGNDNLLRTWNKIT